MHIFLAIALLVSGGLGVSVAADNALPGDTLYGVKTEVNERVRSTVALSTEANAQWEARRAERRLSEGENLVARGALNVDTDGELASRFDAHVHAVNRAVDRLEERGNINAASRIVSNFEAALRAHEQSLVEVSSQSDTRADLILERLRSHSEAVSLSRARIDANITAGAEADVRVAAENRKRTAERAIADARALISRVRGEVSAEVVARSESRITHAESLFAEGEIHLEAEAYADAFRAFQSAHRTAQETYRIVRASQQFGISIGADVAVEARERAEARNRAENRAREARETQDEDVNGDQIEVEVQGQVQLNGGL